MTLSPAQRAAVETRGSDVCVTAGPGSGKTRVLIARFLWLVNQEGVDPGRILAITFTDKAAAEIKERLAKEFTEPPELRGQIERAYVSTVHGFCARLLRENALAAGVDPEFSVLDRYSSDLLAEAATHEALDALFAGRPAPFRRLLESLYVSSFSRLQHPDLAGALRQIYGALRTLGAQFPPPAPAAQAARPRELCDALREALAEPLPAALTPNQRAAHEGLKQWAHRFLEIADRPAGREHFELLNEYALNSGHFKKGTAAREMAKPIKDVLIPRARTALIGEYHRELYPLLVEALEGVDRAYRQRKRQAGGLDFDDLEEAAVRLLEDDTALRERVRAGFDHVLMDELQDTNPLQWRLVNLIRRPGRFFAVGDINQSIFGFRHAEPEVFCAYRTSAGVALRELRENHRSRAEILQAVNAISKNLAGVEQHELLAARRHGERAGPSVELLMARGATTAEASATEAQWIARRVLELVNKEKVVEDSVERPARFSDVAVLARSYGALEPVRLALGAWGVPALLAGGKTFFEAREVRDLTFWLAALANPLDEISLAGVLRSPLVGVSDETLLRLKMAGGLWKSIGTMDGSGFDPADVERLRHFRRQLEGMRARSDAVPPDRLLLEALDDADYWAGLEARARSNIDKFLALVRERFNAAPRPLARMLDEIRRQRAAASEPEAPPDDSSNAVRLMTIHGAKGLEFPIVFVCGLKRGIDRSQPVICYLPGHGLGVQWRDPASGDGVADVLHARFVEERKHREAAEEHRLLYVALTRAGERLVLSCSDTKRPGTDWWEVVAKGLGVDTEAGDEALRVLCVDRPPSREQGPPMPAAPEPEELVARPEAAGQHDSTASVTAIALYLACPRRYYLERYLGWQGGRMNLSPMDEEPEADGDDALDASEFGRQVHVLLAGGAVESPVPEALALVAAFERTELARRVRNTARVEKEFALLFALDDVVLRGQIDLWFEEGGERVLVDYKTDREGVGAGRVQPYSLQLRLYAMALEALDGRRPDRAFLHFLRTGESLEVALRVEDLQEAAGVVAAFKQSQARLDFPLREGKHCPGCPFYGSLCPAGGAS